MNYWNKERTEKLEQLWNDGYSGSKIATMLGDGVSRNAVIGKLFRLGYANQTREAPHKTKMQDRAKNSKGKGKGKGKSKASPKKTAKPKVKKVKEEEKFPIENTDLTDFFQPETDVVNPNRPVTIMELTERTCRWPIGDPLEKDFHYCGKDSELDSPYCPEHCEAAYQPIASRRNQQAKAAGANAKST